MGPLYLRVFGYTRDVSSTDSTLVLLSQVSHGPAVVVFFDLEKALELASPHSGLKALVRKGVNGKLLARLHNYLQYRRSRIKFRTLMSSFQELESETSQDGILNLLLSSC